MAAGVLGTSLHGLLESDEARTALLRTGRRSPAQAFRHVGRLVRPSEADANRPARRRAGGASGHRRALPHRRIGERPHRRIGERPHRRIGERPPGRRKGAGTVILFLSNADTELLALRVAVEGLPEGFPRVRAANPATIGRVPSLDGVRVVIVRLLGGAQAWPGHFESLRERCSADGIALLAFGGESVPDADLTVGSTVPSATITEAFGYLVQGGVANLENLLRFVADTVLFEGYGFEPPVEMPAHGVLLRRRALGAVDGERRPVVGVVCYRAHVLAGNTEFVSVLCDALAARGVDAVAVYTYSLRPGPQDAGSATPAVELLASAGVDAVVTTTLAAGTLDEQSESWDPGSLADLDVPVVQAICATTPRSAWEASKMGLSPVDVAMAIAIPEFDGRIISVPFSFKETVDDGRRSRRCGAHGLSNGPRPGRTGRRAGSQIGQARFGARARTQGRRRSLRVPDQAQPSWQRRRPRHAGFGRRFIGSVAQQRISRRPDPRFGRRADGRAGRHVRSRSRGAGAEPSR